MFAPRRVKRVGLSRKMIRSDLCFSIMSPQSSENAECGGRGQEEKILMHEMRSSMRGMRDFGDKLEDGREAAGGTWWTRRREVAEFEEED